MRHMILPSAIAVLACTALLAGCAGDPTVGEPPARRVVRLAGSGSCMPLVGLLTDAYGDHAVEWRYLSGFHTQSGVRGVSEGAFEVGLVSRELAADELGPDVVYTRLAVDGVVLAVHPTVTLDGLTTEQVRGIYTGTISNWSEIGGPELPITVLDRNDEDSGKIVMRRYVFGEDLSISPRAARLSYQADMADGIQATAGAIGYLSYGYGIATGIDVKYVALDGVEPDLDSIASGTYPVVRPLGIVTAADADPALKAFVAWTASPEAAKLMERNGFAPEE